MMLLLRRQSISMIQRWQQCIGRNKLPISSSTICGDNDIFTAAIRTLSLYSTSTLQQNYNDAPSLRQGQCISMIKQAHIHLQHYQRHISNSLIHNYNTNNQLRWFTSSGRHTHHGGRGRGNDRGRRDSQSTNRIPRMKDCHTLEDAIKAMYDNLDKVSPRDISAFWAVVPRLLRYQERVAQLPQLKAIFYKTADQIHSYGPQDLVTTTLGFAKTIQTLQSNKRRYSSGSYEEYLHSILIRQRDEVFSFLARTSVPILHQFEPRLISNLAYVYALLEYAPTLKDGSNLFDHIAEKSIPKLDKFNPQDLSNIVWAFEKVKVPHPDLYKRVGDHIVTRQHLNGFNPQEFANILIAYAKAEISHPYLFNKVADHIVSLDHLNNFKPQDLANIIWSCAKAELSQLELFNKVGDHISTCEQLNDFIPQNLANTIYAYAKAEVSHPDLFNKVADHILLLDHLNDFQPQDVAIAIYSYAKAGVSHHDLFNKVADHIVSLDILDDYTEQNISNLAWAYNKAGIIRQDLNDILKDAAGNRKEEFGSRNLNNLYRWTSEEKDIHNQEDDEQSLEGKDENDSVAAVDDDNNANKDEVLVEDDSASSIPEDLSLLTVVQLKDRLRNLGLRVSGRKHELISRLNDYFTVQGGDK